MNSNKVQYNIYIAQENNMLVLSRSLAEPIEEKEKFKMLINYRILLENVQI